MAAKYWIKLYHEILDDPKMGRLPDALFRRAIELFLMAGDYDREGALPPLADMAWRLHADEAELGAQMAQLAALDILSRGADESWQVAHFSERQAPAPPAERMRRSRTSARREFGTDGVDGCETVAKRNTDTDTDADTETEQMADADAEAESVAAGSLRKTELVQVFMDLTGLPLFPGDEAKWAKALARMQHAGVTAPDLTQAVEECRAKGLTIASLASLVNPAIIARSRRQALRPEEDHRRYLKGEYGEVGIRNPH